MKCGLNPRRTVSFQMTPIQETPQKSTPNMSGRQPKSESTVRTRQTSTPGGLSKERLFAELLKDLSGSNFPKLASVLLPKLGSRDTMPQRRRSKPTLSGRKRKHEWIEDSEDSFSGDSASFSSGGEYSENADLSGADSEEGAFGGVQAAPSYAAQTRLAPLPIKGHYPTLGPPM